MKSRHHIFIVGCQRSGTTLLGQILGAHPQAVLIDEDNEVYDLMASILSNSNNQEQVLQQCLASARKLYAQDSRFTEQGTLNDSVTHLVFKVPNTTYDYERLKQIHHSNMHFVFAVRDARDVVCSMQRLVDIPMVENQLKFISHYEQLTTSFAKDLKTISNTDTADHIRKAMIWSIKSGLYAEYTSEPLNAMLVRYEDLVSEPNHWIPHIINHVGLDAQSEPVPRHENVFQGVGPGFTERTRAVDKTSLNRWKEQLTAEQEQDIWKVASGLMQELGYTNKKIIMWKKLLDKLKTKL